MPRPRTVDHSVLIGGVVTERRTPWPLREAVDRFLFNRGCEILEYEQKGGTLFVVLYLPDRAAIRVTYTSDLPNIEARDDHLYDQFERSFYL